GIKVLSGNGHTVANNSIYSNGGIGIDLNGDGVTANDAKDVDTGPNNLQNKPTLTSPTFNGLTASVTTNLNSTPNHTFRITFYANTTCDQNEGRNVIATVSKTANSSGDIAAFSQQLPVTSGRPGRSITATATDITVVTPEPTSEFS